MGNVTVFKRENGVVISEKKYENGDYDLTESDNFNMYSAGILKDSGKVHESDFITRSALEWMDGCVESGHPLQSGGYVGAASCISGALGDEGSAEGGGYSGISHLP